MTKKATCSVCKLPVRVKKNGTLYRHINPYPATGPWSEYCPGGNRLPMGSAEIKSLIRAINSAIEKWDGPNNDDFFDMFTRRKNYKLELARRWYL